MLGEVSRVKYEEVDTSFTWIGQIFQLGSLRVQKPEVALFGEDEQRHIHQFDLLDIHIDHDHPQIVYTSVIVETEHSIL